MSEQKFDFVTDKVDHIRPSLPGIYFLINDGKILHIGESNDIKREVLRHIKKGQQFNKVGIQLFDGSKSQRKKFAHQLAQRLKSGGAVNTAQSKEQRTKKRDKNKKKPKGKPAKDVALPQSRLDMARPLSVNGSVKLSPTTAEIIKFLQEQGLGDRTDIIQLAVEQLYKEKIKQSSTPESKTVERPDNGDPDWLKPQDENIITAEAKDALRDWTQKVTQEAMSEITIEQAPPTSETEVPGLPAWLNTLAEEALVESKPIKKDVSSDQPSSHTDSLSQWTQPENQTITEQPAPKPAQKQPVEESKLPEWMEDIEVKNTGRNSTPPFG